MRRTTLEDIARMADVSKATVSRVINNKAEGVSEETRQRVQHIIDKLEYRPNLLARGIVAEKTKTIGLIIPDITNPFFSDAVSIIEDYAVKNGYSIYLCNTNSSLEKEEECISNLISKHVDGILLASAATEQQPIHSRLKKYGIPCVLFDRKLKYMDYGAGIFVDNEFAVFKATEFLLRHGNTRIAFICGSGELSITQERIEGYRSALEAHNVPFNPELVVYGTYQIETGHQAVRELMKKGLNFTAVLCGNDLIAIGAMKALKELNKPIPQEVEVVGFDNVKVGELVEPALTTIEQPIESLSEQAVKTLLQLIEGKDPVDQSIRLDARMVLRDTTKNFI